MKYKVVFLGQFQTSAQVIIDSIDFSSPFSAVKASGSAYGSPEALGMLFQAVGLKALVFDAKGSLLLEGVLGRVEGMGHESSIDDMVNYAIGRYSLSSGVVYSTGAVTNQESIDNYGILERLITIDFVTSQSEVEAHLRRIVEERSRPIVKQIPNISLSKDLRAASVEIVGLDYLLKRQRLYEPTHDILTIGVNSTSHIRLGVVDRYFAGFIEDDVIRVLDASITPLFAGEVVSLNNKMTSVIDSTDDEVTVEDSSDLSLTVVGGDIVGENRDRSTEGAVRLGGTTPYSSGYTYDPLAENLRLGGEFQVVDGEFVSLVGADNYPDGTLQVSDVVSGSLLLQTLSDDFAGEVVLDKSELVRLQIGQAPYNLPNITRFFDTDPENTIRNFEPVGHWQGRALANSFIIVSGAAAQGFPDNDGEKYVVSFDPHDLKIATDLDTGFAGGISIDPFSYSVRQPFNHAGGEIQSIVISGIWAHGNPANALTCTILDSSLVEVYTNDNVGVAQSGYSHLIEVGAALPAGLYHFEVSTLATDESNYYYLDSYTHDTNTHLQRASIYDGSSWIQKDLVIQLSILYKNLLASITPFYDVIQVVEVSSDSFVSGIDLLFSIEEVGDRQPVSATVYRWDGDAASSISSTPLIQIDDVRSGYNSFSQTLFQGMYAVHITSASYDHMNFSYAELLTSQNEPTLSQPTPATSHPLYVYNGSSWIELSATAPIDLIEAQFVRLNSPVTTITFPVPLQFTGVLDQLSVSISESNSPVVTCRILDGLGGNQLAQSTHIDFSESNIQLSGFRLDVTSGTTIYIEINVSDGSIVVDMDDSSGSSYINVGAIRNITGLPVATIPPMNYATYRMAEILRLADYKVINNSQRLELVDVSRSDISYYDELMRCSEALGHAIYIYRANDFFMIRDQTQFKLRLTEDKRIVGNKNQVVDIHKVPMGAVIDADTPNSLINSNSQQIVVGMSIRKDTVSVFQESTLDISFD